MGLELALLLTILLAAAQKGLGKITSPGGVAQASQQAAADAAQQAADAAARGDHDTAAQKAQEAAQHAQQAAAAAQAARTPPAWPQVVPAGLPPFPSGAWQPASPVTNAMTTRAWQLLPQLWASGAGTFKVEQNSGRWVVFRATQMGDKKGVVAFTTAQDAPGITVTPGVIVDPASAPTSAQRVVTPPPVSPSHAAPMPVSPTVPVATSAPAAGHSMPVLRLTSPYTRGPSVIWLQQRLGITADGVFGPGTKSAVVAFQQAHGLSADGVVGPQTWGALGAGSAQAA